MKQSKFISKKSRHTTWCLKNCEKNRATLVTLWNKFKSNFTWFFKIKTQKFAERPTMKKKIEMQKCAKIINKVRTVMIFDFRSFQHDLKALLATTDLSVRKYRYNYTLRGRCDIAGWWIWQNSDKKSIIKVVCGEKLVGCSDTSKFSNELR